MLEQGAWFLLLTFILFSFLKEKSASRTFALANLDFSQFFSLRMGSFNSAPKINNIDSQDDDVDVPAGVQTTADLVNHCKLMRGDNRPELLQRSFFKPINDLMLHDVTDGLRYLHLNSVSKGNTKIDRRRKKMLIFER